MTCPACEGSGETRHSPLSVNPYSGVPGFDPQNVVEEDCWRCGGLGVVPLSDNYEPEEGNHG